MNHDLYIETLRLKLRETLPGREAQYQMAPEHRKRNPKQNHTAYEAAVMLLLYPHKDQIQIILTQRPEYDGHHSGQISFPGGKKEASDESLQRTALRETHEELGINPELITIIGRLTPLFIPISNFMVSPNVGYIQKQPEITPDPVEVEKIIEIPVKRFFDDELLKHKVIVLEGQTIKIPYYDIAGDHVWGATAMILSEFIELHKSYQIIPD